MSKDIINWASDSQGETEPITVTLDGDGDTSVDFETAFGDFSEARGRGRARRQARRLERIRRRQERRRLRRQGRMEAMEDRQNIRSARKRMRDERKGEDEETPSETPSETPNDSGQESSSEQRSYEPSESESPRPIREENEQISESVDRERGQSDEDSSFTGDYGFDGERGMSEIDGEYDNFYNSAEGTASIKPAVSNYARLIEKNKEWILRFQTRLDAILARVGSGQPNPHQQERIARITRHIARRKQHLAMLEEKLGKYSRIDGDFDSAVGSHPRWEAHREKVRQRAEVRRAKRVARHERKQHIKSSLKSARGESVQKLFAELSKTMPRAEAMREARKRSIADITWKATAVANDLKPIISQNRIEVPATMSSFSGTGLIGLDDYNAFDAPAPRNLEVSFSNAEGGRKIDWKNIAIGAGIAIVGIFVYKRYVKK